MRKCPLRKRSPGLRVVLKLKSRSFQWCTLKTRSSVTVLIGSPPCRSRWRHASGVADIGKTGYSDIVLLFYRYAIHTPPARSVFGRGPDGEREPRRRRARDV